MKEKNSRILLTAVVFFWFAQYVYIPYQTPYLNAMGISSGLVGTIIGTYGMSQMLLRLPVGVLADSRNRHKILIVTGALSSGTASLFRMLLNNAAGFLIGNLFSGLASAMWISFMVLYMSWFSADQQQKATGNIILANNLGMLIGFVTSTLLYDLVGMRTICLFSVCGGGIAALFAMQLPAGEEKQFPLPVKELLKVCLQKELIVFSLLAIVQQGVQMSTTMSYTTQILRNLGASSFIVGFASIIYMLAAVCFAKASSCVFCTKLGPSKLIPAVFCTTAMYCFLVPGCTLPVQICFLQILPGLSTGILFTYLTSEAMKHVPAEKKSTAMGFFQAVYALGMTVLPMICGSILSRSSMGSAYLFLMGLCLFAMLCSILYYSRRS